MVTRRRPVELSEQLQGLLILLVLIVLALASRLPTT
jgi:hypothetical protein